MKFLDEQLQLNYDWAFYWTTTTNFFMKHFQWTTTVKLWLSFLLNYYHQRFYEAFLMNNYLYVSSLAHFCMSTYYKIFIKH